MDVNKVLRNAGFGGEDYGKIVRAAIGYAQVNKDATKADIIAFAHTQAAPKPVKINMLEKAKKIALFPPAGGAFERGAMDQMDTVARLPVYMAGALMPDAHQGYAMPVGGVCDLLNAIAPWLVGVDIGCFTGDTKIPLLDGKNHPIAELAQRTDSFPVYACKPDGKIVVTLATAHKTRTAAKLVEVELDNGERITCTPDHQFMLRDGSYAEAQFLTSGVSLMPFYSKLDKEGYTRVQQNYSGAWQRAHWMVARSGLLGKIPHYDNQKVIIHHIDFGKDNNDPENLVFMGDSEHSTYHREIVERNQHWQSPEFEANRKIAIAKKAQTAEGYAYFAERGRKNFKKFWTEKHDEAMANSAGNGERGKKYLIAYNQSDATRAKGQERGKQTHACNICGEEVKSYIGLYNHRRRQHGITGKLNNHKVVDVRTIDRTEDVYCLNVPEYGNFALSAGVFVHNCGMSTFFFTMDESNPGNRFYVERAITHIGRFGRNVCQEPQDHPVLHDPLWQTNPVLKSLYGKACAQLGSSGSGNHYLAINKVDGCKNLYAFMLHSGSRGTGAKVADYYCKLAEVACPANVTKGYGYFAFDSQEGKDYYAAMNLMAAWARANHQVIIGRFLALAKDYIKPLDAAEVLFTYANAEMVDAQRAQQQVDVTVQTTRGRDRFKFTVLQNFHNIAIRVGETAEDKAILRHHKGSTPAKAGQYGIVPGSSGTPSYITIGLGNVDGLESSPHGAGRARSRTATKAIHDEQFFQVWMLEHDIHFHGVAPDETMIAYKDIETVIQGGSALFKPVIKLLPVFSMMDAGESDDGA